MSDKAVVMAELARAVAAQDPGFALAHRLCHAGVAMLNVVGAALTVSYTSPSRVTVCATDDRAARLEDLQDVLGEGPGRTAYETGRQVTAHIGGAEDPRWPQFGGTAAASFGPLELSAIPIRPDRRVLGVLTCHREEGVAMALDEASAQFLADAIGVALLADPDILADFPHGPWASRAKIHQATGMVIAQLGVGEDDATAILRAHAFAMGKPLSDTALDVLSGTLDFSRNDSNGGST